MSLIKFGIKNFFLNPKVFMYFLWLVELLSEKAMALHSSTPDWKLPWTEEPGRLQSKGSLRVGHDWETSLSYIGEGNGNPLQCSCLENPRDGKAWWAAVCGVAQSRTRLKRLSSSSIVPRKDFLYSSHYVFLDINYLTWKTQLLELSQFFFLLPVPTIHPWA